MKYIDQLYANVIFELFDIKIESKEEIDSFYQNIEENLNYEQIELLQVKIQQALYMV